MPLLHHTSVLVSTARLVCSQDRERERPSGSLRRSRTTCAAHSLAASSCAAARTRESAVRAPSASDLRRWDFDSHMITDPIDQIAHLCAMLDHLDALSLLGISSYECTALLTSMQDGYTHSADLPFTRHYHNFSHAFDVTQTLFAMFAFDARVELLTALEKVVLLVAAVGHDIAHPGVSNRFLVATSHPLALAYGYTSVLENMHAAKAMALVERHNVLRHLTSNQKILAQHLLVSSILGTDVTQHDRLLHGVRDIVAAEQSAPLSSRRGIHNRVRICSFLLHCADISNAAKPFRIAEQWTDLIMKEFFEQGEAEKRLGLPVSPNCDADSTSVPDLQIQFIKFAILPTFALLECLLPGSRVAGQNAKANLCEWERKRARAAQCTDALRTERDHVAARNGDGNAVDDALDDAVDDDTDDDNSFHILCARDSVLVLVNRHASAYWQTVVAMLRYICWLCTAMCPTLVDYLVGNRAPSASASESRTSVVMPTCIVIAVALRALLGADPKSCEQS